MSDVQDTQNNYAIRAIVRTLKELHPEVYEQKAQEVLKMYGKFECGRGDQRKLNQMAELLKIDTYTL